MSGTEMHCRICGSTLVQEAGVVEYISGYAWSVYDCAECGSRFTRHDASVYDVLHQAGTISYYADYRALAAESKRLFEQRDLIGLRAFLANHLKYCFVIGEVERLSRDARLLEIGCSRGYLTSWSILDGRNILGVDVSSNAIDEARANFGNHFALSESPALQAGAPYDLIYHVGMIGCVADPVDLTRQLLGLLKPGGRLIFNAPNRNACGMKNQLWFDSAPPPDVVTLYQPGFWGRQFEKEAVVNESVVNIPSDPSVIVLLRKLFRKRWRLPVPHPMTVDREHGRIWAQPAGRIWTLFERAIGRLLRVTKLSKLAPLQPAEFGLHVSMIKK